MFKSAKRWALFTMTACVLALFFSAAAVYLVDPFEIYRESKILPLYDQESYNNPGIVRSYDYNAVVLGTSMVEMMKPSVIDETFCVQSVKLPMRGSYIAQMGWQLEHIFKAKEKRDETLDLAILGVDAYSMVGLVDDDTEIFDYLWNGNPFDDVSYLLNRDVLLVKVPAMLKNAGKSLEGKRDAMYTWTDVVFSEKSVYNSLPGVMAQSEMQAPDYRIERSTGNLEMHIERYVRAHPETTFKIYMPPYSVAYWYLTMRNGLIDQQMRSRALVCEKLLAYDNVEIYDYSSRLEWTENLDNYFDYSHHSGEISDAIIRAMAAGENRVTSVEEMNAGSAIIRASAQAFAGRYEGR